MPSRACDGMLNVEHGLVTAHSHRCLRKRHRRWLREAAPRGEAKEEEEEDQEDQEEEEEEEEEEATLLIRWAPKQRRQRRRP